MNILAQRLFLVAALASASLLAGPLDGLQILIAEDSNAVRKTLEEYFQQKGAVVVSTSDAHSALIEVLTQPERFHILVTDQHMPSPSTEQRKLYAARDPRYPSGVILMYGLDLISLLRKLNIYIPAILHSGSLTEERILALKDLSPTAAIDKASSGALASILAAIEQLLGLNPSQGCQRSIKLPYIWPVKPPT
jgi:CheY-like chemotaxis protein